MSDTFIRDVRAQLIEWMRREKVTRAELARRLDVTPAYVTQMLRGTDLTLSTIARVVDALGGVPSFCITSAP